MRRTPDQRPLETFSNPFAFATGRERARRVAVRGHESFLEAVEAARREGRDSGDWQGRLPPRHRT